MTKYPIDKELVKLRNLHLPNNRLLVLAINAYLSKLPTKIDKDLLEYREWKLGDVTMHMFTPLSLKDEVTPCLYYLHGGGFVFKATDVQYHYEQQYALNCGCRVIGIDYGLMPKHIWPDATNDCINGYKYILENSDTLKTDPERMAIGGDSAGGLLSLESYFEIKKRCLNKPRGLMLIYPVTDNTSSTESVKRFTDTPVWDGKANILFWKQFLNGQEYVSPLQKAEDLDVDNLFVEIEEFDCLHDEGLLLYDKAKGNVSNSVLIDNPGTFHAFDANYDAAISKKTLEARCDFINKCFKRCKMRIEHIGMYVNDLESARDFFVNYLNGVSNDGYHNEKTGFRSYFISFNDGARLELMNKPELSDNEKPVNRTGYAHVAFSVGSKEAVDDLTEKLKNAGYDVVSGPRTTGDGYYESSIIVIEGNQIEITV